MTRLHTIAPDLESTLASLPAERRREIAWAVARWAVQKVGLTHPAVADALTIGSPSLERVVADLDEQYFKLGESGEASQAEVIAAFSLARAASAVQFAACGEAADAVYEAAIATEDVPGVRVLLASARDADRGPTSPPSSH